MSSPQRRRPGAADRIGPRALAAVAWAWTPIAICVPVVAIVLLSTRGSSVLQQTVTTSEIYLIVVVGLYIFVGNSGVLSFGHMAFMAIGAYTSALLTIPSEQKRFLLPDLPHFLQAASIPTVPAALIGGTVAMLVSILVALPLMRLNGIAAGIGTFAFLIVVYTVIGHWTALTRGQQTMLGVPLDTTMTGVLSWACIAIVVAYVFQESRIGLRLRASREDEPAARAIGIGVFSERTIAFALSAFWVGVGGALYGHLLGAFSADAFYLPLTFLTFAMLVIGGINSLTGAVVGTIVVSTVTEVLLRVERGVNVLSVHVTAPNGTEQIVLAVFMLSILILRPAGITGGREIRWPFSRLPDPAESPRGEGPVPDEPVPAEP